MQEGGPRTAPRAAGAGGDDWIALGAASALLGVSAATLRRWSDAGRIPVFTTPGGHRRYSRRALAALIPSRHPDRASLAQLGASSDRIVRAYRRGGGGSARNRRADSPEQPWFGRLGETELAEFRRRGQAIVAELLLQLEDGPDAAEHLARAAALAADHGRRMGLLGCSAVDAVETFLQFRAPFLGELLRLAARHGLDTHEVAALVTNVERALDRLLVATVEGHASAAAGGETGR